MADMVKAFVTGDKELDRKLASLEPKLQKKHMRKATRNGMKRVRDKFRSIAPVETGALRDSAKVRSIGALKPKPKGLRGAVGHILHIDRDALVDSRRSRGGEIGYDSKRNEPLFYAAVVEYRDGRPMRKALYDNKNATRHEIVAELRKFIREAEVPPPPRDS